jgi:hypothetical protein
MSVSLVHLVLHCIIALEYGCISKHAKLISKYYKCTLLSSGM